MLTEYIEDARAMLRRLADAYESGELRWQGLDYGNLVDASACVFGGLSYLEGKAVFGDPTTDAGSAAVRLIELQLREDKQESPEGYSPSDVVVWNDAVYAGELPGGKATVIDTLRRAAAYADAAIW